MSEALKERERRKSEREKDDERRDRRWKESSKRRDRTLKKSSSARGKRQKLREQLVTLTDRRVPLEIVQAALLLAAARRAQRPNGATPLARTALLHYFLPIIDELLDAQPDPGYIRYLRQSLASIAPDLVNAIDHQFSEA